MHAALPPTMFPFEEEVTELVVVVKWGRRLDARGQGAGGARGDVRRPARPPPPPRCTQRCARARVAAQEALGIKFRSLLYPGESHGLLRLHSTYRHDLKIYSSDEGRVQMTAAAFTKGFLDLEGELVPILASLVGTRALRRAGAAPVGERAVARARRCAC